MGSQIATYLNGFLNKHLSQQRFLPAKGIDDPVREQAAINRRRSDPEIADI